MCLRGADKKINTLFLLLSLCLFEDMFPKNPYTVRADFPKACAYITCKRGEQCVSRKFWCKNPPCPSMLYCSKSQKESLKGPSSCETVRCSKGFICLVHVRHCQWDQACEQQIARCVTARDYYEGPASCVDFRCPSDHRCILRESLCARPPCKLLRSCAESEDVTMWLEECKDLGCLSEHECFLRRPNQNCSSSPCNHTPDCSAKNEEELDTKEQCRGWICPKGQECSSYTKGPCKRDACRVSRSCHKPLMTPEKNASNSEKSRFSSRPLTDKVSEHDGVTGDKKNTMNFENANANPMDEGHADKLTTSKSFLPPANITSGLVIKPAVTSLPTWLNHLKLMTGIHAIEVWIKKADKQENHEEFLEWLESVKDMLGSAAYDLWLEEVRAMTVTKTAFQKWLPPSSTNRSPDSHPLVLTNANFSDVSDKTHKVWTDWENLTKVPNDWKRNDFRSQEIGETLGVKNDYVKDDDKYVYTRTNETPMKQPIITREYSMPNLPTFPTNPATMGLNDWSRLYYSSPRNYQQVYPSTLPQNFGNAGSWTNPALPYHGFDNSPLPNPPDPQFPPNWSFQRSPYNDLMSLGPKTWQEQFFPPFYPQWRQARDPRDQVPPNQRILEPAINPARMYPSLPENPADFYPRNLTNQDISWMKYFDERYGSSQSVQPDNYGSYPITDRSFVYPSLPTTNYRRPNSNGVPYGLTRYEDIEVRNFPHNDRNLGDLGEKSTDAEVQSSPNYNGLPRTFVEPTLLREDTLRLLDNSRRNLYEQSNQNVSPFLPSLSRTHRIGVDRILSPLNSYLADNGHGTLQSDYHSRSSYPDHRLSGFSGSRSAVDARENPGRITPPAQDTPLDGHDEVTERPFLGDRMNDVPGQTMEVPDLWNSRYRYRTGSLLRKIIQEQSDTRDTIKRDRLSTKNSSSIVPTTRKNATTRVLPILHGSLRNERNNHNENVSKSLESYSNDDGIYPLLLNLQGYIESPSRQVFQNSSNPPKNSTILPVYTIDNGAATNYYDDDYEYSDERGDMNFFRNKKYGGNPDFPNNLKNVFEVEAAIIMQNRTGDGDVKIKDIKWEYEDEEESNIDELSGYRDEPQPSTFSTDGSLKKDRARNGIVNESKELKNDKTGNDFYDERVVYVDEIVPDDKSVFDSDQINIYSSMNQDKSSDVHSDYLYRDTDHRRFKKNRPL